jgi:erythromycin esterase
MKIRTKIAFLLIIGLFLNFGQCYGQLIKDDETKSVVSWLKKTAIPINYIEAGHGFTDLQPLKKILKDVKIIGLGEASHGNREFFQFKHRMLEFLVKELGFTVFTIESSYAACQNINDYILNGKGDLATSLARQGYTPWDTEEMTEMINWLRNYNKTVQENKKVKFIGIDINYNAIGRQKVLAYFKENAPEKVFSTDSLFRLLDQKDENWPFKLNKQDNILNKAVFSLQNLLDFMQTNKKKLVFASSLKMFEQHFKLIEIMKQSAESNSLNSKANLRDLFMAENVEEVESKLPKEGKIIVWGHNGHMRLDTVLSNGKKMAYHLKRKYGDKYYSVGFDFFEGGYQGRNQLADNSLGERKEFIVPPSPEGTLAWYLKQTDMNALFLNLKTTPEDIQINKWLNSPLQMHYIFWAYDGTKTGFGLIEPQKSFDAIFYVNKTTRARPTKTIVDMNRF